MHGLPELIKGFVDQYPLLAENFSYLLVFTLLYLCGLGLPVPEEATLILGGYLIYLKDEDATGAQASGALSRMIATACAAILLGDFTMYWLGRRFGPGLLSHRWMRWILSKQNHGRIESFYERRGHWAILGSRFVAGIRVGSFFLAGATRVKARTFLLMDGLGALLTVPLSIWLAWHFGEEIHLAVQWLGAVFRQLVYLVALAALIGLWWELRKARKAARPPEPPGAST